MSDTDGWGFREGDEIVPGVLAIKRLGGGRKYEVYLSWDERLYSLVATKLVRPEQVTESKALGQIENEAEVLRRVSHPVVVRLFHADLEGPRPHLVLEHLEGPTLRSLLRRYGPLSMSQLLPLALNIVAALHYLSQEEVVHLDVKPANIVMGAPPRLIDFSVARSVEAAGRITSLVGTDAYMAPEQCLPSGAARIGLATDMWGLGATLYHAVTGRPPFEGTDADGRYPQLEAPPPALNKDIPAELVEPIMRCLQPDPGQRPTPSEFALALQPLVQALPARPVLGRRRPKLR